MNPVLTDRSSEEWNIFVTIDDDVLVLRTALAMKCCSLPLITCDALERCS
jgi:hypothetical protein